MWQQRSARHRHVPLSDTGAKAGPAAPQGSLLILPTAHSSAVLASLAQYQGHGGCRAGQDEAPALPLSSLQGPRDPWGQPEACEAERAPRGA